MSEIGDNRGNKRQLITGHHLDTTPIIIMLNTSIDKI